MKKGHSKLFVYEIVMDPTSVSYMKPASDMTMMAMASGHESEFCLPSTTTEHLWLTTSGTAEEWKKLLGDSGFEIKGIHHNPLAYESVIEAEPL